MKKRISSRPWYRHRSRLCQSDEIMIKLIRIQLTFPSMFLLAHHRLKSFVVGWVMSIYQDSIHRLFLHIMLHRFHRILHVFPTVSILLASHRHQTKKFPKRYLKYDIQYRMNKLNSIIFRELYSNLVLFDLFHLSSPLLPMFFPIIMNKVLLNIHHHHQQYNQIIQVF